MQMNTVDNVIIYLKTRWPDWVPTDEISFHIYQTFGTSHGETSEALNEARDWSYKVEMQGEIDPATGRLTGYEWRYIKTDPE